MQYQNGKRYYTMSQYCKEMYGRRAIKIPLCSGMSCPNRDGTKGSGGCTFCSGDGGGEFAPKIAYSIADQFVAESAAMQKWQDAVKIGYFQSFSNTHCSAQRLLALLEEAVAINDMAAIRIATRADCIDEQKADIITDFSKRIPIEVELGLQTVHDATAEKINRCHSFDEWIRGYLLLKERGIYVCAHLINGLPGETSQMMIDSARELAKLKIDGIKLHMLHVIKGSKMAQQYLNRPFELLSMDKYIDVVCGQIRVLPPDTVIERLTGDGSKDTLIAPLWTLNKRHVLNSIDKQLAKLGIWQGDRYGG